MNDLFHAHRKNLYKGQLTQHIDYVAREGRHKNRADLVARGQLNIPHGASSFRDLGIIGDTYERKGGIAAKAWTCSLPRQLKPHEQLELVRELSEKLAGGKPTEFAIHSSVASDGGRNPHAHIVIIPRQPDGHHRPLERICSRYNAKDPKAGGWKKEREAPSRAGFGLKIRSDRLMIADVTNQKLEKFGHDERVDARSFLERGVSREPGKHLYAAGMRRQKAGREPTVSGGTR